MSIVKKITDIVRKDITDQRTDYAPQEFLTDFDIYLLREGNHQRAYEKMGAHATVQGDVKGVHFAVWAPNASKVSVVGNFNDWDGNRHVMAPAGDSGIWRVFIPGLYKGVLYKYELHDRDGNLLQLKADPYAFQSELRPETASVFHETPPHPKKEFFAHQNLNDPISIYEVHLGSWRRGADNQWLTYRELADQLVPYVKDMGFTHIQLMPISEHPFDGSWGYQPTGLFAPTSRFGTPEDFMYFVREAHRAQIAVLVDWVPGHFPTDPHGLAKFDGTPLYEHADPREGFHMDWNTLIYNWGRTEVANFLLANALFWLDRYQIDGLRVDAVASMLYRDYSRKQGEWVPNVNGGRENLEAVAFLKRLNELIYANFPHAATIAEESTAWAGVSRPTYTGGLGFGYKWNMGWMHDTLKYMSTDPLYRKYDHHMMTFGMIYAYTENFILPLSHDEVVHGKGSLIGKMPGDDWQKFANLRAYYGFMWSHPGKKLLFMGCEFAQRDEWKHDYSLDWHLLEQPHNNPHRGMQNLVRDLNRAYRTLPSLHRHDCDAAGFDWLESGAADTSVYAFLRRGDSDDDVSIVVSNFTPVVQGNYRIAVPVGGWYEETINTDAAVYGGSNIGNQGGVYAEDIPHYDRPYSINITIPPLATLILHRKGNR